METQQLFDVDTEEFLAAVDVSTRRTYSVGLACFQRFYQEHLGQVITIKHFLDEVEEDQRRPRRERRRVAGNTVRGFVDWLGQKGYADKTVRTYVAAVQSMAKYFELQISVRYLKLPSQNPRTKKYPWTKEAVGKFVGLLRQPMHKSIAVSLFQSGLSVSDLLMLTYGDVKAEFEQNLCPLCLDLTRGKTDVPFVTFLGSWACGLLRQYLSGKQLEPGDRIYPVSKTAVEKAFQRAARKLLGSYEGRNPASPHTLRAAFRTLLADAGMPVPEIEFLMAHTLPQEDQVYMSRSREGWRELYRKYEWALTVPSAGTES
jgi:integrase